jgi:hypothetical protein
MGLASQLEEATKKRSRARKPKAKKPSLGEQALLAAAARANATFGDPDVLDGLIDGVVVERVQELLTKIHASARKFKTVRTDDIVDDEEVNYGTYDNPDEIIYFARAEFPAEVVNVVTGSLSPKFFARDLARELSTEAEVSPSSAAKKIASDREVLAFAGKQALEAVLKVWSKTYADPPDENSDVAKKALEFAYKDADDVEMSHDSDEDIPEILHAADLELEPRSVDLKVSFVSPWKFKAETIVRFRAKFTWEDYS